MTDFVVRNAHVYPIFKIIENDMDNNDWELIINDMLKPSFRHDILRETGFAIRILKTLETWVACTERENRRFSHLISFIEDSGRVKLAEILKEKAPELASLQ